MNRDEDQPPVVEPESVFTAEPASSPTVEPVIVPAPAPIVETVTTTETVVAKSEVNTPGVIILQWLSYAFWGWLILALIWLMSVILINAILGDSVSDVVPYAIAAGVVLLPIAFFTDFYYRKHEPAKKTGAAMVIMVIHAVLFALLAIAALISTVLNSINALIESSSNVDSTLVVILASAGAALLYAAAFVRVLNHLKTKKLAFVYSISMVIVTLLLLVLAVVGPLVQTLATKNDRRLEQNLPSISSGINEYIQTNEKLPTKLSEVTFDDEEANLLIEDGLVTYKPESGVPGAFLQNRIEYRYQLCATFKEKDSSSYRGYDTNSEDYSSYLSISGHGKGEVCYKLSETVTQTKTSSEGIKIERNIFN